MQNEDRPRAERLFYAVPLPEVTRSEIQRAIGVAPAVAGARWVPPENLHLTLRFLGDTDSARRASLEEAVRELQLPPPFSIRLRGWGAFPRPARADVLWIGVEDHEGALRTAAEQLEAAARAAGFVPEERPFRPHLTAARLRPPADLRRVLPTLPPVDATVPVDRLALVRSTLGHGPAVYDEVGILRLG